MREKRCCNSRNGLVLHGKLDTLRDRFATHHCVVLENLLEPVLLERIQRHIDRAQWNRSAFDDGFSGTEFTLDEPVTCNLLGLLLNNENFLKAIRVITGCTQISDFSGRVYRMAAGPQHHLSWHNDIDIKEKRQVGFSMNLSADVFRGGTFELRNRSTRTPLAQVNNTGFGDALLFRISADLQHRVTQVVGKVPKTACAGWFRATGKSFLPELVGRMNTYGQYSDQKSAEPRR
jgi:2OG-Fe(II) oxygenase superfamily